MVGCVQNAVIVSTSNNHISRDRKESRMVINKSRTEVEFVIDEWIFHERNRNILKRRLLDGLTYEKLAEEFDMSPQQIKTIVKKCQDTLFCHLK